MKSKQLFLLVALAILGFTNCTSNDDVKPQIEGCVEPTGLLSYAEANELEEKFKLNQYKDINIAGNIADPTFGLDKREFWFSLEDLECYLNYVKQKGKESDLLPSNLGIRVYIGARDVVGQAYPKSQVFFVPTFGNSASRSSRINESHNTFYGALPKDYGSSGQPPKELHTNE